MAPDPFNVKRRAEQLNLLRSQLLPLPFVDRQQHVETAVFGPFEPRAAPALKGKRIGLVASDGSGVAVALVGVKRAFEEAGVEVEAISACSSAAVWGVMWAAGLDAQEMADFSLSWRPQDHVGTQWTRLPQFALSALRGFNGFSTGEALEQLFDRRLWHMSAGETDIPLHTSVYNLDKGSLSYFGTAETPDLALGELVRIALARPATSDAVRVEGDLYVDGAVVDGFPAEPLVAAGDFDRVFGFDVAAIEPGEAPPRGISNVRRAELARRSRSRLGESLTLIEPIPHQDARGPAIHDLFLDRRRWPELMRRGYEATVEALAPFRSSSRRRGRA